MMKESKHFAMLNFEEKNKVLAFPPSKWKESSPFDFKDYTRTEDKTALAKSIVKLVYLGCAETTDESHGFAQISQLFCRPHSSCEGIG